jgi:WhiB family redox-sensing transcriptional regulator
VNNLDTRHSGHRALMVALFGRSGQPPAWRTEAACATDDPVLFTDEDTTGQAQQICQGCPVRALCAADQLAWEDRVPNRRRSLTGVVGGLTPTDRRHLHYPPRINTTAA